MERPIERVALHRPIHPRPIHSPSKHQHIARLRLHHKMLHIDRPLHAARLIRSLEVAADHHPLLLQLKVLRRSRPVRIFTVQSPVSRGIRGQLLRRRLLPHRNLRANPNQAETQQQKSVAISFHPILRVHGNNIKKNTGIFKLFHPLSPQDKILFDHISCQVPHRKDTPRLCRASPAEPSCRILPSPPPPPPSAYPGLRPNPNSAAPTASSAPK